MPSLHVVASDLEVMMDALQLLERIGTESACSVTLTLNAHRDNYQTVAEAIDDDERSIRPTPEILAEMVRTDTSWCIQIYPVTPIGSFTLYDAQLPRLLERAWAELQRVKSHDGHVDGQVLCPQQLCRSRARMVARVASIGKKDLAESCPEKCWFQADCLGFIHVIGVESPVSRRPGMIISSVTWRLRCGTCGSEALVKNGETTRA